MKSGSPKDRKARKARKAGKDGTKILVLNAVTFQAKNWSFVFRTFPTFGLN